MFQSMTSKQFLLGLACLGMMMPTAATAGGPVANRSVDVRLSGDQTLVGTIVDAQGRTVAGAQVTVLFNGVAVAHTKTTSSGRFAVNGLRGGVHQIASGQSRQSVRLWTERTAPASATSAALIVASEKIVRSQGCGTYGGCAPQMAAPAVPVQGYAPPMQGYAPQVVGAGCGTCNTSYAQPVATLSLIHI